MKEGSKNKFDFETEMGVWQEWLLSQWLGAVFEIEGSLYFAKEKKPTAKHKTPHAWPVVRIGHSDIRILGEFKKIFSADTVSITANSSDQSRTLSITRKKAVEIAEQIQPFSPSRKMVIDHFIWWSEANTSKEQYLAATRYAEHKKNRKEGIISEKKYAELIENPAFVAGLVDMRGSFLDKTYPEFSKPNNKFYDRHRQGMTLFTSKINLLEALHKKYLGTKPFRTSGVWGWSLGIEDLERLMEIIKPYSKFAQFPRKDST